MEPVLPEQVFVGAEAIGEAHTTRVRASRSPLIPAERCPALRVGWNGPSDRMAGLAVCFGYDTRRPCDHPAPFEPTEL